MSFQFDSTIENAITFRAQPYLSKPLLNYEHYYMLHNIFNIVEEDDHSKLIQLVLNGTCPFYMFKNISINLINAIQSKPTKCLLSLYCSFANLPIKSIKCQQITVQFFEDFVTHLQSTIIPPDLKVFLASCLEFNLIPKQFSILVSKLIQYQISSTSSPQLLGILKAIQLKPNNIAAYIQHNSNSLAPIGNLLQHYIQNPLDYPFDLIQPHCKSSATDYHNLINPLDVDDANFQQLDLVIDILLTFDVLAILPLIIHKEWQYPKTQAFLTLLFANKPLNVNLPKTTNIPLNQLYPEYPHQYIGLHYVPIFESVMLLGTSHYPIGLEALIKQYTDLFLLSSIQFEQGYNLFSALMPQYLNHPTLQILINDPKSHPFLQHFISTLNKQQLDLCPPTTIQLLCTILKPPLLYQLVFYYHPNLQQWIQNQFSIGNKQQILEFASTFNLSPSNKQALEACNTDIEQQARLLFSKLFRDLYPPIDLINLLKPNPPLTAKVVELLLQEQAYFQQYPQQELDIATIFLALLLQHQLILEPLLSQVNQFIQHGLSLPPSNKIHQLCLGAQPSHPKTNPIQSDKKLIKLLNASTPSNPEAIYFILNNLSPSNCKSSSLECWPLIQHHILWFSDYIVQRIIMEPNFHRMYWTFILNLCFLSTDMSDYIHFIDIKQFKYTQLYKSILYHSINQCALLLNDSLLKHIGHWIGFITLAQDVPLLNKHINLKQLVPSNPNLVCFVLSQSMYSTLFHPPNPYIQLLVNELQSINSLDVDVLFKQLNITRAVVEEEDDMSLNIIQRSIVIATITTRELISKDFKSNNHHYAQLMVKSLATALALVTAQQLQLPNAIDLSIKAGLDAITQLEPIPNNNPQDLNPQQQSIYASFDPLYNPPVVHHPLIQLTMQLLNNHNSDLFTSIKQLIVESNDLLEYLLFLTNQSILHDQLITCVLVKHVLDNNKLMIMHWTSWYLLSNSSLPTYTLLNYLNVGLIRIANIPNIDEIMDQLDSDVLLIEGYLHSKHSLTDLLNRSITPSDSLPVLFSKWHQCFTMPNYTNQIKDLIYAKIIQQVDILTFIKASIDVVMDQMIGMDALILFISITLERNKQLTFYNKLVSLISMCIIHYPNKGFVKLMAALMTTNKDELVVMVDCLHCIQPHVLPEFSFGWMTLISHRYLLSNIPNNYHLLIVDVLYFMQPFYAQMTESSRLMYKGILRLLLILLHDVPDYLCRYYILFIKYIPNECIQLKNLILSCFPRDLRLPDPFTPGLDMGSLKEISDVPDVVYSTVNTDNYGVDVVFSICSLYPLNECLSKYKQMMGTLSTKDKYKMASDMVDHLRWPNTHSYIMHCSLLHLFRMGDDEVKEIITRVLLERLIANRPHPWCLLTTFVGLIKGDYGFWENGFVKANQDIERLMSSVSKSIS